MRIQNRHEFPDDVRSALDALAGRPWEYSSLDERTRPDGGVEVRYVIHDAAGNELCAVVARKPSGGEPTYAVEG